MKFTKMHGCGNDFVLVEGAADLTAAQARDLCDRRRGIGADGVLAIGAARGRCWPVTIHNADGSLGGSCGNGARCAARYLLDRHGGDELELSFSGGDVKARRQGRDIAIALASPAAPESLALDGMRAYRVSLGNPHLVIFVADPAEADLTALAAAARAAVGQTNVEVARVVGADLILLRVDERGVGETLACGTGACATVAAALSEHPMAERVTVRVPGGDLLIRPGPRTYELAGPAEYVFEGSTR
ncbi:MAG: diaminopimelate epimerase [Chloroflexi bacterium]|nr:MAG: diaminopimelate epimerase [Chloroflexota bacterium]